MVYRIQDCIQNTGWYTEYRMVYRIQEGIQNTGYRIRHGIQVCIAYRNQHRVQDTASHTWYRIQNRIQNTVSYTGYSMLYGIQHAKHDIWYSKEYAECSFSMLSLFLSIYSIKITIGYRIYDTVLYTLYTIQKPGYKMVYKIQDAAWYTLYKIHGYRIQDTEHRIHGYRIHHGI